MWADVDGRVGLYTTANGPDGTLDLNDADGGRLIGADAQSLYLERSGASGGNELWRRFIDGRPSDATRCRNRAETGFGPILLSYSDVGLVPTFIVGPTSVVKLWIAISRIDPAESLLLVQGARISAP